MTKDMQIHEGASCKTGEKHVGSLIEKLEPKSHKYVWTQHNVAFTFYKPWIIIEAFKKWSSWCQKHIDCRQNKRLFLKKNMF